MKTRIRVMSKILIVLLPFFGATARGQSVIQDPAALYCKSLGYDYKIVQDSSGAESGICVFPDSSTASAWSFYRGEIKPEYSYCAKKGLNLVSITDSSTGFYSKCAYCVTNDGRSSIAVKDLMIQNGDIEITNEFSIGNLFNNADDSFYVSNRTPSSVFPNSFDWRSFDGHSYIGPIRSQGFCGACYAFATVACAEGTFNFAWGLYDNNVIELSESFIMWCLGSLTEYHQYFHGCDGSSYHRKDIEALTREGVCLRSLFPYQTSQPDSCNHWNDTKVKFSGWYRINCNDIESMKDAILKHGIIRAGVNADSRFDNYSHGIYKNNDTECNGNPCESSLVNHAVAIVGWGTDEEDGEYWIIRNSWGTDWGEDGYMKISMKSAKIACNAAVLIPEPATYISDYANHSSTIVSNHNAETIAMNEIVLSPGFHAENGSEYVAKIQPSQRITPTAIDFSELEQVDNYNTKILTTVGIPIEDGIAVYPNPVQTGIYIMGIPYNKDYQIAVYNIRGERVIKSEHTDSDNWIDFLSLPSGTYIVCIVVDERVYAKKIIKN